jgi:hypothetical protein
VADFTVRDEGTLVIFTPTNEAAREWWVEHVAEGVTIGTYSYVVEHRFADPIIIGAANDGFSLRRI